jgi:hypothetical protein
VGMEALFHQIGVRMRIPGIGEDSVQRDLAGDTMIPVPNVATIGVSSYHSYRPINPYEADELFAEPSRL